MVACIQSFMRSSRSRISLCRARRTASASLDVHDVTERPLHPVVPGGWRRRGVRWVNEVDSTTALSWIGTYAAATEAADTLTWTSVGDVAQMETALLASGDDSKEFTYENGKLKHELTAMGVTMTVEMERQ